VVALVFDVRTPAGAEAGKAYTSCTVVTKTALALCSAVFVLNGGQIHVQAPITFGPAPRLTGAVIGGTGIYEGVTGQARRVGTASGVLDQTFFSSIQTTTDPGAAICVAAKASRWLRLARRFRLRGSDLPRR